MKPCLKNLFFACAASLLFVLPARALVINTTYDASVTGSANSAQIQSAFNTATGYIQNLFTNNITINITVYWGATGPFAGGVGLGASSTSSTGTRTYSQMTNLLRSARTTVNDSNAVASLPAGDPVAGDSWWFTSAQGKALGIVEANSPSEDGAIGFASDKSYTFDPTNRAVSGKFDFIGVAIHEITEVMGRLYFDLSSTFIPYDLFRFTNGARCFSTTAAGVYFSTDNGVTPLRNFNTNQGLGDLTDWALSGPSDCCDYSISSGRKVMLSYADLVAVDIIGYHLNYQPPNLTGLKQGTNFLVSFTNTPGTTYAIFATTNLTLPVAGWSNLGTNNDNVTPGQFLFTNPVASTNLLRFYRARLN